MNTSNNQRYTKTQNLILHTFKRLLEEKEFKRISISEICKLANINRATFYLHFIDIYDLMEKTEESVSNELVSLFTTKEHTTIGKSFLALFHHIKHNKCFYKGYLKHGNKTNFIHIFLSDDLFEKQVLKTLELGYMEGRELMFHEAFFKAGLSAMIVLWLEMDCLESPEAMVEIIAREYSPNKHLFEYRSCD